MIKYFNLKLICIFLYIPFIAAVDLPNPRDPKSVEGCDFLLTNMRSGTNLTICSLQLLTRKPVRFFDPKQINQKEHIGVNRLRLDLDESKSILFRTHDPSIGKISSDKNRLLIIVRNPKEIILGFVHDDAHKFSEFLDSNRAFRGYLNRIRVYDKWNPDNRLLIYYEDLVLNPEETLPKILDFFDESHENLEYHLANIEEERLKIAVSYSRQHKNGSNTLDKTQDIFSHSKKMPLELLMKADEVIKRVAPDLWERYLYRYETTDE